MTPDLPPDDALIRRRSLPPDARRADWVAADGWRIRTLSWAPVPGRPSILFLNGRADFIEKYSESYWHWRRQGYGLFTFDWRGQGASGRFPAGTGGYFDAWLADLAGLAERAAALGGPLVLAGHSMGGHLALRHLAAGAAPRYRRAVLFAPMAGIAAHGVPPRVLSWLARARVKAGAGDAYPPMQGPYGERTRSVHRQRILTGDPERFADEGWWIDEDPGLAFGGASWRWIMEASASCDALAARGVPEAIGLPVDVFIGDNERLVDAVAARRLVQRLPDGRLHVIAGAAHELLRERSAVQAEVLAAVDGLMGAL
ncbi:alpha/beta fold hydrolase [Sphingosinicella microcystinivorans]|uniref:alpha/beta fold hydrolase n=1 Tax=Sphingosinicella microcystinivorans TaxID=335406 RepID=UPI0022F384A8|nr:alpha/beta hydrolase [Sphingosinicella microcystinivorans]WBX85904.1 alpha/beta hydrolase [Sphingosinicella microcystinivorans]